MEVCGTVDDDASKRAPVDLNNSILLLGANVRVFARVANGGGQPFGEDFLSDRRLILVLVEEELGLAGAIWEKNFDRPPIIAGP